MRGKEGEVRGGAEKDWYVHSEEVPID